MLRYLIEEENKDYVNWKVSNPIYKWEIDDWCDYKDQIHKTQILLGIETNVIKAIVDIIAATLSAFKIIILNI